MEKNLNHIFVDQTDKVQFYNQAKKRYLSEKERQDLQKTAMMEYYQACGSKKNVINASLIQVQNNTYYLCDQNLDLQQAKAVGKFFAFAKHLEDKQVRQMVID